MKNPELQPHEKAALDEQREAQSSKQPYAAETDARELEHAHEESRPLDPKSQPKANPRS